jgi:Mg2+ and Co2+ transporter CorA
MVNKMATGITGINTAGIAKMQQAVQDYKNSLVKLTNISASKSEIQAAIKGTSVEAQATTLINTIDQQITVLFQSLDRFQNRISTLASNYSKYDTSSNVIRDVSDSVKS